MLNPRELATVLAALRSWQRDLGEDLIGGGHFTEHPPLSPNEIDDLCERLNCKAANPSIVLCVADGAVQAAYAPQADLLVSVIDWDADPEHAHLPGVVVIESDETALAAYVSELTTDSLDSLEGGDAEKAILAAQIKAARRQNGADPVET